MFYIVYFTLFSKFVEQNKECNSEAQIIFCVLDDQVRNVHSKNQRYRMQISYNLCNSYFAEIGGLTMRTMTSLDAQNHFGELIDTSQREPVLITRRGRPVSFVLSTSGNPATTLLQVMKLMNELSPLKGVAAVKAFDAYKQKISGAAEEDGLTEDDITALVHANR
ncbi:type II toxin-antitoxin system Phd/YefM family antitoxin [Methylomonas paludis]|uniref:Type II toxin-antitoxin system Phd/YefM family antitoxin n=1 Tax=Methylomonas paludis TaxID=1173101 RepID=A0A975MP49_9GAMM|nr:type II toxin-antitoxin system Phd/YefM family antitoxin [Methylomonas paludis]QWF71350.1 type II toxin-antitoxin system Phd/YefM family antitoxin [Methylomonas paludis]